MVCENPTMKSALFVICVLAGTIGLTSAQCDYNKITSCANDLSNGVMEASTSVAKICKLYNDFVDCIKEVSGCADIKQQLNSLTSVNSEQLRICETNETAECQDTLLECVSANVSSSFSSFHMSTKQSCERLKKTKDCLMDEKCENDPMIKKTLDQVKAQTDQLKCDGSSPQCSDKLFKCSLFGIQPSPTATVKPTTKKMCEYIKEATDCLSEKTCENDPQVKQMLQSIKAQAALLKCEDKSPNCFDQLFQCSMANPYLQGGQSSKPTKDQMCQQTKTLKECLVQSGCESHTLVKEAVDNIKAVRDKFACVDGAISATGNVLICILVLAASFFLRE